MTDKWRYDLCSVKRQCEAQVYKFKNSETLHIVNGFEQYVAPNTTDVTGEIVSIIWIKYRKKKSSLAFTNIQNFPFKRDPWVCRHKKKVKYRRVMNGTRTPGDMTQGNIAIPICSCSYRFSIVHSMQQYVYTICPACAVWFLMDSHLIISVATGPGWMHTTSTPWGRSSFEQEADQPLRPLFVIVYPPNTAEGMSP